MPSQSRSIPELFEAQKRFHPTVKATDADERVAKLKRLREAILTRRSELHEALRKDYRKCEAEAEITEIFPTVSEIDHTIKHLRAWMKPERAGTPMTLVGTRSEIIREPKGVVLIIGPWNYPFSLVLNPLAAALAAGCCAILKPSELTPNTSALLGELIRSCFDEREVAVVEGDVSVSTALLKLPFDHIFFTGSTRVGRVVMEAAARNLTPVTLELGGKSPVVIDETVDLGTAAKRIVFGKFLNAGQTCVAPDYVLVPEAKLEGFVAGCRDAISKAYGAGEKERKATADLCRIINLPNLQRIRRLTEESIAAGARVAIGGAFDEAERYIAPTILTHVKPSHPIMSEEIFGPVLPVLTYRSMDEVYALIGSRDKPLALYVFSEDSRFVDEVLARTTAGGTCVNDTILHLANPNLPFGGVGASGMGAYHGPHGFKAFSHERAVLRQGRINPLEMMYPPYTDKVKKLIAMTIKYLA